MLCIICLEMNALELIGSNSLGIYRACTNANGCNKNTLICKHSSSTCPTACPLKFQSARAICSNGITTKQRPGTSNEIIGSQSYNIIQRRFIYSKNICGHQYKNTTNQTFKIYNHHQYEQKSTLFQSTIFLIYNCLFLSTG